MVGRVCFSRASRIPVRGFACTCTDCGWIELGFHLACSISLGIRCSNMRAGFAGNNEMSPKIVDRGVFET